MIGDDNALIMTPPARPDAGQDRRATYLDLTASLNAGQLDTLSTALDQAMNNTKGRFADHFNNMSAESWSRYYAFDAAETRKRPGSNRYWDDRGNTQTRMSRVRTKELASVVHTYMTDIISAIFKQAALFEFRSPAGDADSVGDYFQMDAMDYYKMSRYIENVVRESPEMRKKFSMFCISGLVCGVGFMRVDSVKPAPSVEIYTDKGLEEIAMLADDPDLEFRQYSTEPSHAHIGGMKYHVKARRIRHPRTVIQYVPATGMVWPANCVTFDQSITEGPGYLGQLRMMPFSELRRMHPGVAAFSKAEFAASGDSESYTMFRSDPVQELHSWQSGEENYYEMERQGITEGQEQVSVWDEYVRLDLDGDGIEELVNVKRSGKRIFHIQEVAQNPFVWWSPLPIDGRAVGLSMDAVMGDLQEVSQRLARGMENSAAKQVTKRHWVNMAGLRVAELESGVQAEEVVKQLNESGIGSTIRGSGRMEDILGEEQIDPRSTQVISSTRKDLLSEMGQRTGIMQGMNEGAGAQTRSTTGLWLGMTYGKKPVENVADAFAESLSLLARKVLRLEICQATRPIRIMVNKEWHSIDPRYWRTDAICAVHVSGTIINQEQRLTQLELLLTLVEKVIGVFGPDNPLMNVRHLANIIKEVVRTMQFSDENRFVGELNDNDMQLMMQKMMEMRQGDEQGKLQVEREKLELEREKVQMEMQLEHFKALADIRIKMIEMTAKAGMEGQKAAMEAKLAELELYLEQQAEMKKIAMQKEVGMKQAEKANIGSSVRMGGKVG